MKKKDRYTAFYSFMAPYLEQGNKVAIALAKKEWRKRYKANWRKEKRQSAKEITTTWEKPEYNILTQEAKRHKETVAGFVKRSSIAYMDKRYLPPDKEQVAKVIQLIALLYNRIDEFEETGLIASDIERKLLQSITDLEQTIRVALHAPKTIEQVITTAIKEKPSLKGWLISYIKNIEA